MEFNLLPSRQIVDQTLSAFKSRNINGYFVENKAEALAKLKSLIPPDVSVMTGSSTTLEQIGFVEYLKTGDHRWKNLKNEILAEKDPAKQMDLRKKSTMADYFVASVHAITEDGRTVTASQSGSQIPAYAFLSNNVIWVAGAQKIVPTYELAMERVRKYVFPLEDKRMKSLGAPGSNIGMLLTFERLLPLHRKISLILVNEKLGF